MVQFFPTTMGQNSSLPKPGRRKSLRSFRRKSANNLSHTFTISDDNHKIEQVNINQATEEELMTLDGINRELAKSIVEHRKAIGRFRKVEDLVLVLGASRLEKIKPEICVSTKRNLSCASSRTQSFDSLRSNDSKLTVKSCRLINVNKATVFELQCVHGITQEIAANIVLHREKKGPFKKVEDLIKVKGIDHIRLGNISRSLTTETTDAELSEDAPRPSILTNGFVLPPNTRLNGGPLKLGSPNGLPLSSLIDIFELLSAYSPRPILEDVFMFARNGEPAFRVGTWNLHHFSQDKANNLGVREVVCRTILENGLSILAVQGISDVVALKTICEELNKPKLRRIEEWRDKNRNWNFCMLDIENTHLGFLYDSDGAIDIELTSLIDCPEPTKAYCEALIGRFRVGDLYLELVNMKIHKNANQNELHLKIKDLVSEEDMVMILVDYSELDKPGDWVTIGDLQAVLPTTTSTCFPNTKGEPTLVGQSSNILSNPKAQNQFTNFNGVVKQGLTHLAIPNGWNWGGPVSPHCPVWTELFLNCNQGTAL